MKDGIENKRKFLIAFNETSKREDLAKRIQKHISHAHFIFAQDGSDAFSRISNETPHVIFLEKNLNKITGIKLTENILADKKFQDVPIVIISEIPESEYFVDEVVIGRVQFLGDPKSDLYLSKALSRAMNYVTHGEKSEFYLRFLAPGDKLIKEGEKADYVYIVKKGQLRAFLARDGEEVELGKIQPGEFVGEMAFINGEPRSADVVADTDCELIEIPVDHMDHFLFQKPTWSKALFKTLSRRVKEGNTKSTKVQHFRR